MPAAPVVLLSVAEHLREEWGAALEAAAAKARQPIALHIAPGPHNPAAIEYMVYSHAGPVEDFTPYTNLPR